MSVIDNLLPQEIISKIKKLRTYFQQALLSWIKNSDEHSRQNMHKILQQISQLLCAYNDDEQQIFWQNTTQNFVTAIANPNIAKNPKARKLCSRIDKQLAQLCEGNLIIPNDLTQELTTACQAEEITKNNDTNLVENIVNNDNNDNNITPNEDKINKSENTNNNLTNFNAYLEDYEIIETITINSDEIQSNEKNELLQKLTEITHNFYIDCDEIQNNIDQKLFPIYLTESSRKLRQILDTLNNWKSNILLYNIEAQNEINRELHTIKGDSYLAGITPIGVYLHQIESNLKILTEELKVISANNKINSDNTIILYVIHTDFLRELCNDLDFISTIILRLRVGQSIHEVFTNFPKQTLCGDSEVSRVLQLKLAMTKNATNILTNSDANVDTNIDTNAIANENNTNLIVQNSATLLANNSSNDNGGSLIISPLENEPLAVNAAAMDKFVNQMSEIATARTAANAEIEQMETSLQDLSETMQQIKSQSHDLRAKADILQQPEIADAVGELTKNVSQATKQIEKNLLNNVKNAQKALKNQAKTQKGLTQNLLNIRIVPFATIADRLQSLVQQCGESENKAVQLIIIDHNLKIDSTLLARITPLLEHMIRNAVVHGIETAERRAELNKNTTGKITLQLRQESNRITLILSDDGQGIDLERIFNKAKVLNWLPETTNFDDVNAATLYEFMFRSGFSTIDATNVKTTAGRGFGMDIVKKEIENLGGQIEIHTAKNVGSSFKLRLPLTLAVSNVLMVSPEKTPSIMTAKTRKNQPFYAIDAIYIDHVVSLTTELIEEINTQNTITFDEELYNFCDLKTLLSKQNSNENSNENNEQKITYDLNVGDSVILLNDETENLNLAVAIAALGGNQSLITKNVGSQLANVVGIGGCGIDENGKIVIILDIIQLIKKYIIHENLQNNFDNNNLLENNATNETETTVITENIENSENTETIIETNAENNIEILVENDADIANNNESENENIVDAEIVEIIETKPETETIEITAENVVENVEIIETTEEAKAEIAEIVAEEVITIPAKKVLLVDDSLMVRKLTTRLLSPYAEKYQLDTAKDGNDALQKISENIPDIVVSDIEMPNLNGLDLLAKIKETYPKIQVIIMSSLEQDKYKDNAMQLGANDFLKVPFTAEQLVNSLNNLSI